ncbi:hypothetical protein BH09ACT13_BH09ACT13_07280 [soil metagenome]
MTTFRSWRRSLISASIPTAATPEIVGVEDRHPSASKSDDSALLLVAQHSVHCRAGSTRHRRKVLLGQRHCGRAAVGAVDVPELHETATHARLRVKVVRLDDAIARAAELLGEEPQENVLDPGVAPLQTCEVFSEDRMRRAVLGRRDRRGAPRVGEEQCELTERLAGAENLEQHAVPELRRKPSREPAARDQVERLGGVVPVEDDLALLERPAAGDREQLAHVLGRKIGEQRRVHGPSLRHERDIRNVVSILPPMADALLPGDEVRPVTVLFADIVGSTALGERLAPDEVKALVGECVTMMSRAVEEYGGMVQAYAGDGICAYFGVPAAHDDDPERAARSGLRILELVAEYAHDVEAAWGLADFAVRVGINTGQAAVGQVGAAEPGAVALGDATNVAARLQSLAEPGTIAVGDATARRLSHRFVFEALGELEVKGRKAPVTASRLVGPKARASEEGATPLAGRDDEMTLLLGALGDLVAGRGRIVLLLGDPGMGKTRLVGELRALAGDRVTWLEGNCLSYGGLTAWPFVEALLGWLGSEIGEPEIAVRTKARARLGALFGGDLEKELPALGRLLRIRSDGPPDGSGGADQIREAYIRWLETLAQENPVVVALEDVHWADTTTRELAEAVLELAERAPVAVVLTAEPAPGSEGARLRLRALGDHGHRTTEIPLSPLSDQAAEEMLSVILGSEVDPVARMGLVREAEGNPLYVEELARALLEGGLEPRGRTWTVTVRADLLPPALENLLVARIDRLPAGARQLAPTAAAIGRTFPVAALEYVAEADVGEGLTALLRAEIVREVRRYPVFECSFTHGLLHDAALSTLTPARKRELYTRIAEAFESLYADSLDDHLERLAHYHAQAGDLRRAFAYAERARAGTG